MPQAASWVFRAVPFVVLGSTLILALIIPTVFPGGLLTGLSDFVLVAGILMVGAIFLVLGGLDPGSAFGGMGASREMTLAAILEPTVIMVFATYGLVSGSSTIGGMLAQPYLLANPFLWLSIMALVMLALAENARYPVDNPATHLELTMVHEAMVLEYSGPYLAMLEYASALKLTIFAFLISNFIFPGTLVGAGAGLAGLALGLVLALAKLAAVAVLLALLESTIVKMRFFRMNEYASVAFLTAFFGMAAAVLSKTLGLSINYHSFFAVLTVFFTVLLFGNLRIRPIMRYYMLSSLAIAGVAAALGVLDRAEAQHLFIFAAVTVLIKVVAVPLVIAYAVRHYRKISESPMFMRPASSYLLSAIILVVAFLVMSHLPLVGGVAWMSVLFAAIALVMLGVMKMVIMRNIYSQIVGLLVLENGLALFTLVTVKTLPILVELGIFAVTLVSVFILSKLSVNIKELYSSTDTEELRNLTD